MYLGKMYGYHSMVTFAATISKHVLPQVPFVTRFENVFGEADPAKFSWFSRGVRRTVIQWAGPSNVAYSKGTILRDSDRLIFLCERHRDELTKNWQAVHRKACIIPPPPNMALCSVSPTTVRQRGRQKLGLSSESFVIVFLGYIYPAKSVDTLLRAFEQVCRRRSDVRLLFIGGRNDLDVAMDVAYVDKVEGLSRQLQIDGKITWSAELTAPGTYCVCGP